MILPWHRSKVNWILIIKYFIGNCRIVIVEEKENGMIYHYIMYFKVLTPLHNDLCQFLPESPCLFVLLDSLRQRVESAAWQKTVQKAWCTPQISYRPDRREEQSCSPWLGGCCRLVQSAVSSQLFSGTASLSLSLSLFLTNITRWPGVVLQT